MKRNSYLIVFLVCASAALGQSVILYDKAGKPVAELKDGDTLTARIIVVPPTQPSTQPATAPAEYAYPIPRGNIKTISPADSIQDAMNAAPAGSFIVLADGVYKQTVNTNRGGITLLAAHAGQAILDGAGRATLFKCGAGTTVAGIRFINADDGGAGNDFAAVQLGSGCLMQDCEIKDCKGGGVTTSHADNCTLVRVRALSCGRYGIGGSVCKDLKLIDTECAFNNLTALDTNGGGGKFTRLDGALFLRHKAHDNAGVGLWFDAYNIDVRVSDCDFYHNLSKDRPGKPRLDGDGIWFEISGQTGSEGKAFGADSRQGPLTLENSRLRDNEAEGAVVYASCNVSVAGCTFINDALVLKDGNRFPFSLHDVSVTGNTFSNGGVKYDHVIPGSRNISVTVRTERPGGSLSSAAGAR